MINHLRIFNDDFGCCISIIGGNLCYLNFCVTEITENTDYINGIAAEFQW